ncbi:cbb3-type cytochrome oxidase assembly protein CcoS [Pseudoroseicyclus sp. H15]
MNVLTVLIPISVLLGLAGLATFVWTLRSGQYDDPMGDRERILDDRWDDAPKTDRRTGSGKH